MRAHRRARFGVVLTALALSLGIGLLLKAPCASGHWGDGRQYLRLCYSDIVPLYAKEQLDQGRVPYFEAPNEYPVGTGMAMALAASFARGYAAFFYSNAALLSLGALVTALSLHRMVGDRALYFALSPTLAIYGFMNWDLLAVALATLGTLAYLRRRDFGSGALLGLGAATKLYPGLLVPPFLLGRLREGRRGGGMRLGLAALGAWIALNLPFALFAPRNWAEFFRFNSERPADWDSVWFIGCHRLTGELSCGQVGLLNAASLLAFVAGAVLLWRLRARADPAFPAWTFGFPLLVVFLLTNKVYSPQYGLWLLPWFALALPDLRLFIAFQAADVAVFVTRFAWFGNFQGLEGWVAGMPIGAFEIAVLARAAILVACLAAWARGPKVTVAETAEASVR